MANKALLQNTYIMGGGFAKAISLNELDVFFPELFEKMHDKTTEHLYGAVTWIYRATQIRANALQGLKYKVWKGETEIFDSRNDEQQWFPETDLAQLLWRSEADRMLWGASYWEKVGGWMMPTNLRRLNPLAMRVITDNKGIKRFEQHIGGRPVAKWLPREIVYQPLWRPDDDNQPGVAPAAVARMAAGLNENSLRYAANFFEHGAIPPVILTTEQNIGDQEIERIRTVWQRLYGSVRNAWRTAVLRKGLKPVVIGQRTKDLAIPELHEVVRAEIAAAYGMSLVFLEGKTANRATDEQETLKFVTGTVIPDAELFESGMNRQLWDLMGLRWEYLTQEIEAIQQNEAQKAQGYSDLLEQAVATQAAGLMSFEQGAWVVSELYAQMGLQFPEKLAKPTEAIPEIQVIEPGPPAPLQLPAPPAKVAQVAPGAERMWQDVHRWRKVVKRLGPEKALKRGFETDVLTEDTQQYVRMHLELADTTEEALEIFEHPFAKAVRETAEGDQDPNAAAKDRDEARIGLDMRRFFRVQLARIIKKLGKRPDINRLTFEFWQREREALGAVLQPHIDRMAEQGALTAYDTNPVTGPGRKQSPAMLAFDWTLIAEEAALWAEGHGAELITGVATTTQRIVAKKVAEFIRTPGMTIGDLRNSLQPWFNPVRAQMIAVTETTTAFAEGERVLINRARRAGLKVEAIWLTSQDELVCIICGPLHNKPQKEWESISSGVDWPPAHIRCRCFLKQKWEVPRVERALTPFTTGRLNTAEQIEQSGGFLVSRDIGIEATAREEQIAQAAIEELRQVTPNALPRELVRLTSDEYSEVAAMQFERGVTGLTEQFFDENVIGGSLGRELGGRVGILAHEQGHDILAQLTEKERRKWREFYADSRQAAREASKAWADAGYPDIDTEPVLTALPSYQAQVGFIEDIAETYRVSLRLGENFGYIDPRKLKILNAVLKRMGWP